MAETTPKEEVAVTKEEAKVAEKAPAKKSPAKKTSKTTKTAEKEPAAKKTAKAADKKPAAKEETKAASTAAPKKAPTKKAELKPEMFVQYQENTISQDDLYEKVKADWTEDGHRMSNVKSLKIYVKPEENKAYYVINEKYFGDVNLFV